MPPTLTHGKPLPPVRWQPGSPPSLVDACRQTSQVVAWGGRTFSCPPQTAGTGRLTSSGTRVWSPRQGRGQNYPDVAPHWNICELKPPSSTWTTRLERARAICCNWRTTSACSRRRECWQTDVLSGESSAPSDAWSGTTSTPQSGERRHRPEPPSCAQRWNATTLNSISGSTSWRWPSSTSLTRASAFWLSQSGTN